MNLNEMTEAEIVKELKSAVIWFSEHGRNTNTAIVGICERAIDIINGKNAEIDRLTAVEEEHRKQNGELRKEVDRLSQVVLYNDGVTEIKIAKAIKEFLEKAKAKVNSIPQHHFSLLIVESAIDQIAKEMGVE